MFALILNRPIACFCKCYAVITVSHVLVVVVMTQGKWSLQLHHACATA